MMAEKQSLLSATELLVSVKVDNVICTVKTMKFIADNSLECESTGFQLHLCVCGVKATPCEVCVLCVQN